MLHSLNSLEPETSEILVGTLYLRQKANTSTKSATDRPHNDGKQAPQTVFYHRAGQSPGKKPDLNLAPFQGMQCLVLLEGRSPLEGMHLPKSKQH